MENFLIEITPPLWILIYLWISNDASIHHFIMLALFYFIDGVKSFVSGR